MFKELKVVKIIVFFALIIFVISTQISKHKNIGIIFKPLAYNEGTKINYSLYSNSNESNFNLEIKNLINNKKVIDTLLQVNKTYDFFDKNDYLTQGYQSDVKTLDKGLPSGLYIVNNEFPLIVSSNKKVEVTIVVPIMNEHLYNPYKGLRAFESDSMFLSMDRKLNIDNWTKGMSAFFSQLEESYKVNYITDLDLENKLNLDRTELIILYGRLKFWTPKMMNNLNSFVDVGGKLLISSSDIFYAKSFYNEELKQLSLNENNVLKLKKNEIKVWRDDHETNGQLANVIHSNYGGKNKRDKKVTYSKIKHPIFKDCKKEEVLNALSNAEYLLAVNKKYHRELLTLQNCENSQGTETLTGVTEIKYNNSPQIISVGSSDYCLEENQKELSRLFLNTVNYLLKK